MDIDKNRAPKTREHLIPIDHAAGCGTHFPRRLVANAEATLMDFRNSSLQKHLF